jgi:hypothetical protein
MIIYGDYKEKHGIERGYIYIFIHTYIYMYVIYNKIIPVYYYGIIIYII